MGTRRAADFSIFFFLVCDFTRFIVHNLKKLGYYPRFVYRVNSVVAMSIDGELTLKKLMGSCFIIGINVTVDPWCDSLYLKVLVPNKEKVIVLILAYSR